MFNSIAKFVFFIVTQAPAKNPPNKLLNCICLQSIRVCIITINSLCEFFLYKLSKICAQDAPISIVFPQQQ
jgi:hypothetical protein